MIEYSLAIVGLTLLAGILPLILSRKAGQRRIFHFSLLLTSGFSSILLGASAMLINHVEVLELPAGLPWLHWHLRLDALSAFFFMIIGIVVTAVSIYGFGYCRQYDDRLNKMTAMVVFTSLYVAAMQLVFLADDAFAFMVAWELMSLSSYFLVAFKHEKSQTRSAAFLYLLMAHIGGLAILLSFGVLAAFGESFSFDAMRSIELSPIWATVAFLLAFLGFGTKAGLVPVHLWLPEAHPVAPSHISSLLSAAIVKVALYGFIRVSFDLVGEIQWQWGVVVLVVGAISALYGVLYAFLQTDLKRLLAYSTIENMGVIFVGLGLAMIFLGYGYPALSALAFIASLYHALNHACFKGLLFLGAGSVLNSTHDTNLNNLGGLIRTMPWTALMFLVGSLSIASLPPFNGFVSEWLTFQAALQAASLDSGVIRVIIPISAAVLALTAALGAACFVKAFGITFLGLPRSKAAVESKEAPRSMLIGQGMLAILCLVLGVIPSFVVDKLSVISMFLFGHGFPSSDTQSWLWLTPINAQKASYGAPLVFIGISLALIVWFAIYLKLKSSRKLDPVPRVPAWDCGFGPLNARTQYTAESFSMPIQRVFKQVFDVRESIDERRISESESIKHHKYSLSIVDLFSSWLYQPVANAVDKAAKKITLIQTGHLHHYLTYSFITLMFLLWFTL